MIGPPDTGPLGLLAAPFSNVVLVLRSGLRLSLRFRRDHDGAPAPQDSLERIARAHSQDHRVFGFLAAIETHRGVHAEKVSVAGFNRIAISGGIRARAGSDFAAAAKNIVDLLFLLVMIAGNCRFPDRIRCVETGNDVGGGQLIARAALIADQELELRSRTWVGWMATSSVLAIIRSGVGLISMSPGIWKPITITSIGPADELAMPWRTFTGRYMKSLVRSGTFWSPYRSWPLPESTK